AVRVHLGEFFDGPGGPHRVQPPRVSGEETHSDRSNVADSISRVPELPDILAYLAALEPRVGGKGLATPASAGALRPAVGGKRLEAVRLGSPFLLRSIAPPLSKLEGRRVVGLSRMGKRIVFALEGDLYLVLH